MSANRRAEQVFNDVIEVGILKVRAEAERDALRCEIEHLRAENRRLIELLASAGSESAWPAEYSDYTQADYDLDQGPQS